MVYTWFTRSWGLLPGTDHQANSLIIDLQGKSSKDFTYLHRSEMHNSSTVAAERTLLGALGMESWVRGNGWESPNFWELLIPDLERDGTVINRDTIWSASRVKCCLSKGARENAGYGKCFCVLKNESWNCIRIYTEKCSVPCTHRAFMILAILSIILQHKPFNNGSWGLPVCSKGQVHKLLMEYRWRAAGSRYCGALKQTTYTSM